MLLIINVLAQFYPIWARKSASSDLGLRTVSSQSPAAIQGKIFPLQTGVQITYKRIILGEEGLLLKFQILALYPRPTDLAYHGWEPVFLKQTPRRILHALGLQSRALAASLSCLRPLPHSSSESLGFWLLGGNGSRSMQIPEDSWLESDPVAKNSFPIPPNNAGYFSRQAQRKSQLLFLFWLIGDSLAINIPFCVPFPFYRVWAGQQRSC